MNMTMKVLWYRDKNRPAETRCVTVDDVVTAAVSAPAASLDSARCDKYGWSKDGHGNTTCAPPPPCARFFDRTFTLSAFALLSPEQRAALAGNGRPGALWQDIASVCEIATQTLYHMMFTTTCRDEDGSLVCDWARPSPATLLSASCKGEVVELPLWDDRIELSPDGCVQHNLFQPSSELCRDRTVRLDGCGGCLGWSQWTCVLDEYKESCLEVDTNQAEFTRLSTCEHLDRFVIVPIGCLDDACSESRRIRGEQVIEFEFLHALGLPATECLAKLADPATAGDVPPACGRAQAY